MQLYEKEIVTKVQYLSLDKKLERPLQQVWDLLYELDPDAWSEDEVESFVKDEQLREYLEMKDVIEADPISGKCKASGNFRSFMSQIEELRTPQIEVLG